MLSYTPFHTFQDTRTPRLVSIWPCYVWYLLWALREGQILATGLPILPFIYPVSTTMLSNLHAAVCLQRCYRSMRMCIHLDLHVFVYPSLLMPEFYVFMYVATSACTCLCAYYFALVLVCILAHKIWVYRWKNPYIQAGDTGKGSMPPKTAGPNMSLSILNNRTCPLTV